jgi:tetratricopeptide (TPR) repeat protein
MNRIFAPVLLGLALAVAGVRAETPDDDYVRVYNVIQSGDALAQSPDQIINALNRYMEAQAQLQKFQKANPEWNPKVVNYRLNYLASKVAALSAKVPSATARELVNEVQSEATPSRSVAAPAPTTAVVPRASPEVEAKLAGLQEAVRRLQGDKSLLEAKLKEALAAQPAAVDPRELEKARAQVQSLMKQNELLKSSLADKPKTVDDTKALGESKQQLAEANRKLTEQMERANALALEKKTLQGKLDALTARADNAASLEQTRKGLDEANRKLAEQTTLAKQIASEKESLTARVRTLTMSADAAEALRAENEILKKQLAQSKATSGEVAKSGDAAAKLSQAEARIAALQSDAEILRLEKTALENRVKTLATQPATGPLTNSPLVTSTVLPTQGARREDLVRIKQLEAERDELTKKLETANKELYGRKGKAASTRIDELNTQITNLRARLEVFEARAVPYSAEELALFKQSETHLASSDPNAGKKSMKELPSGVATLVASAQRHFVAKEFDQAEADYLAILRRDEKNAYTLANLAAIQLERGRLDEAEKNIKAALVSEPEDPYNLSILGYVKFRQQKYDDALDALSRAARLDPSNAEIQNYLGLTLSYKGLRGPAETALRKSIQLNPGYGSAHNNLAVIYATQTPPLLELARWHYDRAVTAGHPRNAELEKILGPKPATSSAAR